MFINLLLLPLSCCLIDCSQIEKFNNYKNDDKKLKKIKIDRQKLTINKSLNSINEQCENDSEMNEHFIISNNQEILNHNYFIEKMKKNQFNENVVKNGLKIEKIQNSGQKMKNKISSQMKNILKIQKNINNDILECSSIDERPHVKSK